jgi:hypothetical protein
MVTALLAVAGIGGLVLFWHAALEARESANRIATDTCREAGVQLLDETVFFQSLRIARDHAGWPAVRRTYIFEYTEDGERRRRGFVVLLGHEIETVGLGPRAVN